MMKRTMKRDEAIIITMATIVRTVKVVTMVAEETSPLKAIPARAYGGTTQRQNERGITAQIG